MQDKYHYYFRRTVEHIQRVQTNALWLISNCSDALELNEHASRVMIYNVLKHDRSKFTPLQFDAYVDFSWAKKNNLPLTSEQQSKFDLAWKNHYMAENHHPERLRQDGEIMSKLNKIEMICDLQAMAQEFGECSCRGYLETKWIKNNAKYFGDDWISVRLFIEKILKCFESVP